MKDIKTQIQQALEIYSQKTVLRAAVNAIPYVGGSIDVLLLNRGQKIVEQRVSLLFERIKDDLEQIKEDMIDKKFLETDEFFDLLRKAIELSIKTRDKEKIKLYAHILRNALLKTTVNKETGEEYIEVLSELSIKELSLAKVIYEMQSVGVLANENELQMALRTGWDDIPKKIAIPREELDFLLKRLERTGIIKEITGSYFDYSGGVYIITQTFLTIMNSLNRG